MEGYFIMNEIFMELWNLNIKQLFLLIAFIIEILFLIFAFFVYCYEKNETLELISFIRKKPFLLILLLTIPAILLLLVFILKDTFSLDGWFSFLGGYFGVIGAIGGICWQLNEVKKRETLKALTFFYTLFVSVDKRLKFTCRNFYSIIFESNKKLDLTNNDLKIIFSLEQTIASNLFINITEDSNFEKLFTLYQKIISFQEKMEKYMLETETSFNEVQLKKIAECKPFLININIDIEQEKDKFYTSYVNIITNSFPFKKYLEDNKNLLDDLYSRISYLLSFNTVLKKDSDFLLYFTKLSNLLLFLETLPKMLDEINDAKKILKEKI